MKHSRHFADTLAAPAGPPPSGVVLPDALARVVEEAPSALVDVVTAAVHPLEIAASLETCGLSNSVVHKRFGQRDVFSLAEQLYAVVEFRPVLPTKLRTKPAGGLPDLGRGVVFATPTLMFAGAAIALHSWLSWWTVPLALICGWAFSQLVAYSGFSRKAVAGPPGATVVWALLGAMASCIGLGLAGDLILGGSYSGVLFAAAACVFMTAAAELVAQSEERLIGLMLVPGAVGSLVFITREPFVMPAALAVALALASVGGTVLAALRHVPARWWREPAVAGADVPIAVRYFANGCCCGFFVALFMVLEPANTALGTWPGAAAYPMILSLGVMEWQLRSLAAGSRHALIGSYTLAEFSKRVRRKFARSALSYLGALAVLTVLVQALAEVRGTPVPASLLAAATCLAVAFFLGLGVAAYGRVDLVLRAWLAGLAVYGALAISARVIGRGWAVHDARFMFCSAVLVALVALAVATRRVLLNPVCHA